jgi:ATP-dependent Clp protease ATP-binding subunit ClpA
LLLFLKIRLHFQPELLNGLDDIVFFQTLNNNQLTSVLNLQLRLFEEQNIKITLTDEAIQATLQKSYNPSIIIFIREMKTSFLITATNL